MSGLKERFLFACAPDSWGVLDYPGPSWEQSYEKMLDEMVEAGYTGTELGPYGFFPTDAARIIHRRSGFRPSRGYRATQTDYLNPVLLCLVHCSFLFTRPKRTAPATSHK